jgi:hypothetical protein
MSLFNPHIASGLIETPAPAAENDAPKAGIVLVVGPAGSGPTTPVEFENGTRPYEVYGTKGTLARDIELAVLGADFGARVAGTRATPRVVGLRLRTGTPSSATFFADVAKNEAVMRIETVEPSEREWRVTFTSKTVVIDNPVTGKQDRFFIDRAGEGIPNAATSPLALADVIRKAYAEQLLVDVFTNRARWELAIDAALAAGADPKIVSSKYQTVLRMDRFSVADMAAFASGPLTWIDAVAPFDFTTTAARPVHNRPIPTSLNKDARFYAITAGRVAEVPENTQTVRIPQLADAKRVGVRQTNTLLNLRTTGEGKATPVTLEEAGTVADGTTLTKVSEGYWRVRNHFAGNFNPSKTGAFYTAGPEVLTQAQYDALEPEVQASFTRVPTYVIEFNAPEGIADEGGALSEAFAGAVGLGYTKDQVSKQRLGEHFAYAHPLVGAVTNRFFRLDMQSIRIGSTPEAIPINFDRTSHIPGFVEWEDGMARVHVGQTAFAASYTDGRFDDAYVLVSYDSCLFPIAEKAATTQLTGATALEYAVAGDQITFNRVLPHALVVRGLRVQQYRLGADVEIRRRAGGNEIMIYGEGKQPGEGGGAVGFMEVIFGADYEYEPEWPVEGTTVLLGGSSGANADVATIATALGAALSEFKDQDYKILVPSGIYVDDVVEGYDPVTGVPQKASAGLLEVLSAHQARVSQNGAAGIVYSAVRPMLPASQNGRYTEEQKRRRFRELTQADVYDGLRAATLLSGKSFPTFFLFDAPFAVNQGGSVSFSDGVAFYAGIRSAMTNETALYQVQMPSQIVPLYRYDAADIHMPSLLAQARINVWTDRRGEVRLADERTAAGLVPDAKGKLVDSGFRSGIALLAAIDFLQGAVAQLRSLLGPLPTTGPDTLRGMVVTILQGVANRTVGVKRLDFNPDRDILIRAIGGNALGLKIRLFVQVAGELRVIEIEVGATVATYEASATSSTGGIPIAS